MSRRSAHYSRPGRAARLRRDKEGGRPETRGSGHADQHEHRILCPARTGKPAGGLGISSNPSPCALQLDEAERAHLLDLARAAAPSREHQKSATSTGGTAPQRSTDPGRNDRHAPLRPQFTYGHRGRQQPRRCSPPEAQRNSRARWARHNVRFHRSATKTLHNPLVGDIELTGDSLELPGEGLTLIAYTAEPGSHAQQQLDFLTSWGATGKRPAEPAPANAHTVTTQPPEGESREPTMSAKEGSGRSAGTDSRGFREELTEARAGCVCQPLRFVLHLSEGDAGDLIARIEAVLNEYTGSDRERSDQPAYGGIFVLHRSPD